MSESQVTVLFGVLALVMALILFFTAGPLERANRPAAKRILKTSPNFEKARSRLSASILGGAALLLVLFGAIGGSLITVLRSEWWVGILVLLSALLLIVFRRRVAKPLARPTASIYGDLNDKERRDVTSRVLFGVGLFVGWGGLALALQPLVR
ncbi:hypothetical protein GC088_12560 [Arthrobacter sp. JZ12]|uniref:hypothetical protein n=1 Tax=Arthrobacter sp. JZ12 TaxID=2654190 RepID=UPI002B49ED92|nr:hypothetical protein [Arthrobacter sp. JZ12]WRH25819.1 hypothetical protein GC088_12560 [Arthrobacter sp. JZ12]